MAISGRHLRLVQAIADRTHLVGGGVLDAPPRNGTIFAGDFPVIRPGTAKLHPKGTSSRFALRAPRPLWGLAMTNLWRSPSYRQPALAVSTAPGAACRSPTMAGACIGSGPKFAGCTRCVGDAAPYNTPSILQQYPQKMQSLFSETAFFYRPNRRKCALPARDPSAPGDRAARAGKRRRL